MAVANAHDRQSLLEVLTGTYGMTTIRARQATWTALSYNLNAVWLPEKVTGQPRGAVILIRYHTNHKVFTVEERF
jgi:hypothetical protein